MLSNLGRAGDRAGCLESRRQVGRSACVRSPAAPAAPAASPFSPTFGAPRPLNTLISSPRLPGRLTPRTCRHDTPGTFLYQLNVRDGSLSAHVLYIQMGTAQIDKLLHQRGLCQIQWRRRLEFNMGLYQIVQVQKDASAKALRDRRRYRSTTSAYRFITDVVKQS